MYIGDEDVVGVGVLTNCRNCSMSAADAVIFSSRVPWFGVLGSGSYDRGMDCFGVDTRWRTTTGGLQ